MKKEQAIKLIEGLKARVNIIGEAAFLKGVFGDTSLVKDIYKTYKIIFNKEYKIGCRSCFSDCYFVLYSLLKTTDKTLENMENLLYELPKGRLLQVIGDNTHLCTNANLTNELAEWHLKRDPFKIVYFSKFPSDWKQRCELLEDEKPLILEQEKTKPVEKTITVDYPTRKIMLEELKGKIKGGATISNEELKIQWLANKG